MGGLGGRGLQAKADLTLLLIDREHLHVDLIADGNDIRRIGHAGVSQLADVNEAILLRADVDEGAELGQPHNLPVYERARLQRADRALRGLGASDQHALLVTVHFADPNGD